MFAHIVALLLAPPFTIPTSPTDIYGDPLPDRAVARLGTVRFRHTDRVIALTFLPDGKTLIAADEGGNVILWDVNSGRRLRQFAKLPAYVSNVAFAADGKSAVIVAEGHTLLWDVIEGKEVRSFESEGKRSDKTSVAWDAAFVATGLGDNIVFWDRATGRCLHQSAEEFRDQQPLLALSGDGKALLSSTQGVFHWDIATGNRLLSLPGPTDGVEPPRAIASLPKGREWVVADPDRRSIAFRSSLTGAERLSITAPANVLRLLASPDGKQLAASDDAGGLTLWDTVTGAERHRLPPAAGRPIGPLAYSADGRLLAAGSGNEVRLWETASGKSIGVNAGHCRRLEQVACSRDGKIIATSSWDGTVRLWDRASSRELRCLHIPNEPVERMSLSPDGRTLVWVAPDGTIRLLDVSTGNEVDRFRTGEKHIYSLAFAPDGQMLATGDQSSIRVWETSSGNEVRRWSASDSFPLTLDWSPDGKKLAAAFLSPRVRCFDVTTGTELVEIPGGACSAALSPDGRWIASSRSGSSTSLFDVKTGNELRTFRIKGASDGDAGIAAVAFSRDGRMLAVNGDQADAVVLFEVATGAERRRIPRHTSDWAAFALSPDGRTLVTGEDDSTALVWDLWAPPRRRPAVSTTLWSALTTPDADAAFDAMTTLAASPRAAVALLAQKLSPAVPIDAQRMSQLISDLDSDEFLIREKATSELAYLGEDAESALRHAQVRKNGAEMRRRLAELLDKLRSHKLSPERLQQVRALETLEHIDSSEARDLLQRLAQGAPDAWLTKEAAAALTRRAK